ncbi:hypothetical protein WH47_02050 [Habropoda laboriosa]|uniref:Uncharacterized protein n=1 Tax=Habropoda laboriosa TaxID=597456 RepID=A0A0L7QZR9_9HYME|nr:hypothetical protein WH47_02050 [Habropoda laboriosa]
MEMCVENLYPRRGLPRVSSSFFPFSCPLLPVRGQTAMHSGLQVENGETNFLKKTHGSTVMDTSASPRSPR